MELALLLKVNTVKMTSITLALEQVEVVMALVLWSFQMDYKFKSSKEIIILVIVKQLLAHRLSICTVGVIKVPLGITK